MSYQIETVGGLPKSTFVCDLIVSSAKLPGTALEVSFLYCRSFWDDKVCCINKGAGQKEMRGANLILKRHSSCRE